MTLRHVATIGVLVSVIAVANTGRSPAAPATAQPARAPLTGLPDPTGVARHRPALAVKIENTPDARPQSGLDTADVVYEEVVEGGITRFWAIFDSAAPADVGPVRSVRALDANIISAVGGVAAYSGGTLPNEASIRGAPVTWVDQTNAGDAFVRRRDRVAPHNLYAHTALLWRRPGQPVPPKPLFTYSDPGTPTRGEAVHAVTLGFAPPYDVIYTFDHSTRAWTRAYGAATHVAASGRPIAPTNVIIQFVTYTSGGDARLVTDTPTQDAWVLSDGKLTTGHWSKPDRTTPTRFTDSSGAAMRLRPGRTWVELLPAGAPVHIVPSGSTTPTTSPSR